MNRRARVPIRVRPSTISGRAPYADRPEVGPAASRPKPHTQYAARNTNHESRITDHESQITDHESRITQPVQDESAGITDQPQPDEESLHVWRDRALRLQAEIENFRKRQRRLAEERILADRERLLRSFLRVADDLERALNADGVDGDSLRQGVDLTHQTLMRILDQEGAETIEALGQPFDPAWHEAVGTVPNGHVGVEPDTVVEVVEAGYRMGDRLLRPARVIVAT